MNTKRAVIAVIAVIVLALGVMNTHPTSSPLHPDTSGFAAYQPTVIVFHLRVYMVSRKPTITQLSSIACWPTTIRRRLA